MNFHAFWDKINGKMYENVPPPVKYDLANYMNLSNSYELRPITWDDQASYARDDVDDWYKNYGRNITQLGKPMTDEEFKKHYGNPH